MSEIDGSQTNLNSSVTPDDQATNAIKNPFLPEGAEPPATFEEYLALTGLTDWPMKEPFESLIKDFKSETQEEIFQFLKSATLASNINPVQELSESVEKFEEQLCQHARLFMSVCDPAEKKPPEPCPQESVSENLEGSSEKMSRSVSEKLSDATKKNGIEFCKFPGFDSVRLNPPGDREPASILDVVTVAQSFKPGFLKFWNEIFQSEASVAILLDAFWWTFLDRFQPQENREQSRLFDRIANNFVALISRIRLELKDKFLVMYADCLAQAIYVTYFHSFPESGHHFSESFKDYLIDIVHEWVTGGLPPAKRWKKWKTGRLLRGITSTKTPDVDTTPLSSFMHGQCDTKLVYHRFKEELDQVTVDLFDEEKNMIKATTETDRLRFKLPKALEGNLDECKEKRMQPHSIHEEVKKERTLLSMKARSPLVSHYMQMLALKASKAVYDHKGRVLHTQDKRLSKK